MRIDPTLALVFCLPLACVRPSGEGLDDGGVREVPTTSDRFQLRQFPGLAVETDAGGHLTPFNLAHFGGGALFQAEDVQDGCELWFTDGTDAGTHLVADLALGPAGSCEVNGPMTGFEGRAYFLLGAGWLWSTDGTAAGTAPVSLPFTPLAAPFVAGGFLLAWSTPGAEPGALWRLFPDGGSTRLTTGAPGGPFVDFAGQAYFAQQLLLWKTDGTAAGTTRVFGHRPYSSLIARDGSLFYEGEAFPADGGPSSEAFWRSGGAATDAVRVADGFNHPFAIAALLPSRLVYLVAGGVFSSDGTAAGSASSGAPWQRPFEAIVAGDHVFLTSSVSTPPEGPGAGLFVTDGLTSSTLLGGAIGHLSAVNDRALFMSEHGVGSSDGTAAGTLTLVPGSAYLRGWDHHAGFAGVDGGAVFLHRDALWRTDGTPAGTAVVWTPEPQAPPTEQLPLTSYGERVVLRRSGLPVADSLGVGLLDPSDAGLAVCGAAGSHLYVATAAGAWGVVEDRTVGKLQLDPGDPLRDWECSLGAPCGDDWCFPHFNGTDSQLIALSPDRTRTVAVPNLYVERLVPTAGGLFLINNQQVGFYDATTRALRTAPRPFMGHQVSLARAHGGKLWLRDRDALDCTAWESDATEAGTKRLGTLNQWGCVFGLAGDVPLYVGAATPPPYDGGQDPGPPPIELFDARTSPPTRVATLGIGAAQVSEAGDRLAIRLQPGRGPALSWVTDGTSAGTHPILGAELSALPVAIGPDHLLGAGGSPSTGNELVWIDAATGQVSLLADLNPGPGSSNPGGFTVAGDRVYFSAFDGTARSLFVVTLP